MTMCGTNTRGAAVHDGFHFSDPSRPAGVRGDRTWTHTGSLGAIRGAHAVEFSKTVARSRGGDSSQTCASACSRGDTQTGLASIALRGARWRAPVRAQGTGAARSIDRSPGRTPARAPASDARSRARLHETPANRHACRRRNWRLPTCSTAPSSRSPARDRGPRRRAPRRRVGRLPGRASGAPPSASARTPRRSGPACAPGRRRRRRRRRPPRCPSGSACWTKTRSKCSAAPAASGAEWKRSTSRRARACLASRAEMPAGASSPSSSAVPARHRRVRDAQRLAVHLLRRLGHADVVAQRLGHLARAVDPREDRHRQRDLLGDPVRALDVAPEQEVELLVGARRARRRPARPPSRRPA